MNRSCDLAESCGLSGHIVRGTGPDAPALVLIGEAPGYDEDLTGEPFTGRAGSELSMYLRKYARINRSLCWVDNVVKCRPPKNRDPRTMETLICTVHYLDPTLDELSPSVIAPLGLAATRHFVPDATMEKVHGMPVPWTAPAGWSCILIPAYHPAAGLHSPRTMRMIMEDFRAIGDVVRGNLVPRQLDVTPRNYGLVGNTWL